MNNEFLVEVIIELINRLMIKPDGSEEQPIDIHIPHSECGTTFVRATNLRIGANSAEDEQCIWADRLEYYAGQPNEDNSDENLSERIDNWYAPLMWAYAQRARARLVPARSSVEALHVFNAGHVRATFFDAMLTEAGHFVSSRAVLLDDSNNVCYDSRQVKL